MPENTTPARPLEVLAHALRIHHHAGDDAREAAQHVIERDEAVGQNDALDRRMRDVALVPERDVLERRLGVAAQQPREADDLLAADRVALVRHRRRALLPLPNGSSTSPISVFCRPRISSANFSSDAAVMASADISSACRSRWITCDDDRRRLQAEAAADVGLDRRRQVREGADRAGELADADRVTRALHALDGALKLRVPERELEAERHRLGVDAVRPPDHRRPAMLERAVADRLAERGEILEDEIAGLAHLQRLRRVDDVRRGHAEMQPARRRPDLLGDGRGERDDVVLRGLLDFLDARDVEGAALADVARRRRPARCPAAAIASAAAVSTSSQVSYRRWSLQIRPMSGCV